MTTNIYFKHTLEIICNIFEAYSAVLFLPCSNNQYYLTSCFSLGDNILEHRIEAGQGLIGWIVRNDQPVLINNLDRESHRLGYYSKQYEINLKSFMGTPLQYQKGVLALDSKTPYSFGPKDQKILYQFTQLLENLYSDFSQQTYIEQQKNYYWFLQILRGLRLKYPRWLKFLEKFLSTLAEYTNFEYCFFASRDETGSGYYLEGWNKPIFSGSKFYSHKFDINSGLIGWVFKNNSVISTAEQISVP